MSTLRNQNIRFFQNESKVNLKTYYISMINIALLILTVMILKITFFENKVDSLQNNWRINFLTHAQELQFGLSNQSNEIEDKKMLQVIVKKNSLIMGPIEWNAPLRLNGKNKDLLEKEFKKMLKDNISKDPLKLIKFQFESGLSYSYIEELMKVSNEFGIDHFDFMIRKEI